MRVLKPISVFRNPNVPLTDEEKYEYVLGDGEIVEMKVTPELEEVEDVD